MAEFSRAEVAIASSEADAEIAAQRLAAQNCRCACNRRSCPLPVINCLEIISFYSLRCRKELKVFTWGYCGLDELGTQAELGHRRLPQQLVPIGPKTCRSATVRCTKEYLSAYFNICREFRCLKICYSVRAGVFWYASALIPRVSSSQQFAAPTKLEASITGQPANSASVEATPPRNLLQLHTQIATDPGLKTQQHLRHVFKSQHRTTHAQHRGARVSRRPAHIVCFPPAQHADLYAHCPRRTRGRSHRSSDNARVAHGALAAIATDVPSERQQHLFGQRHRHRQPASPQHCRRRLDRLWQISLGRLFGILRQSKPGGFGSEEGTLRHWPDHQPVPPTHLRCLLIGDPFCPKRCSLRPALALSSLQRLSLLLLVSYFWASGSRIPWVGYQLTSSRTVPWIRLRQGARDQLDRLDQPLRLWIR